MQEARARAGEDAPGRRGPPASSGRPAATSSRNDSDGERAAPGAEDRAGEHDAERLRGDRHRGRRTGTARRTGRAPRSARRTRPRARGRGRRRQPARVAVTRAVLAGRGGLRSVAVRLSGALTGRCCSCPCCRSGSRVTNHSLRCSAEPCVQDSGSTRPWRACWIRSSPTASAAFTASAMLSWRQRDAALRALVGELRPDAGVAVGLQLQRDRVLVRVVRVALLRGAHLALGAEEGLQVVAELVRRDVRLRELALRAELLLELVEEAELEVDLLVRRAVERADLGRRRAAPGLRRPG